MHKKVWTDQQHDFRIPAQISNQKTVTTRLVTTHQINSIILPAFKLPHTKKTPFQQFKLQPIAKPNSHRKHLSMDSRPITKKRSFNRQNQTITPFRKP